MTVSSHDTENRVTYVNGEYIAARDARISIFDRGFLFGDGIYEVTAVLDGKLIDSAAHMARLRRSTGEIGITLPWSEEEIVAIERELIRRNKLTEGLVYLQVTRGDGRDRDFVPYKGVTPSIVLFTQAKNLTDKPEFKTGISVLALDDLRWKRRDIKTVCLLPQALAKEIAKNAGCDEAWMIEDGTVTEGASSTAYIVTDDDAIITRPNSNQVLPGCTRHSLLQLIAQTGMKLEERAFTLEEAYAAREAFLTSASSFVSPVTRIDGKPVGNGKPGPVSERLRTIYLDYARRTAI
ncbi:D-amino acid aminotransferase [Falsochrobactrum shanghaiense]|uniref:Probable branched-chain-amino-acid aminotransferase n=1 Tax=Falsochrobactrum shanghaiense TaxID=2201899 RepID=A0A316J7P0_9HYPH|nr:D-amino-acid transaminase [Falsochrobactrum shanghaiense]PWL17168.1 D-amino acid aminotransferase [Falsochrobactrum shanghaiense]